MNDTPTPTNDEWIVTDNENYIEIASIKTCDSIASVHGGKTIGDQYDLAGRIARVPQLERDLTAVTEQLDEMTLRWELTNDSLFDKRALADRLAEALRKIQKVGLVAVDAFDELDRIDEIVDEALAAVKGGSDE